MPPARRPLATIAFGAWLAVRDRLAAFGLILAALGALVAVIAAFAIARHGGRGVARVPTFVSEAIAWGAGVTIAFGASLRAIDRDREQGILALVRARGVSLGAYVRGRLEGLVVVLAAAIGGPTVIAGLAATSSGASTRAAAARATAGALAYCVAFAATLAPIAMASLGARTRIGGYLTLVAVLVVPELLSPWTSALLPHGWHELTSVPAALEAVRAGVFSPPDSWAHTARAIAGLAAVVAVSVVVVGGRVSRRDAELAE
jgi:hypothetical protein